MAVRLVRSVVVILAVLLLPFPVRAAGPGCHSIPITPDTPTGIAGCVVYGQGTASMWGGPGIARNDCLYPWTDCQLIAIRSLQTGVQIIVRPRMFGDLYTGTSRERIVDLDPAAVAALGLTPSDGLWPVEVYPVDSGGLPLPNTSTR